MSARQALLTAADDLRSDGMHGETLGDKDAIAICAIDALLDDIILNMLEQIEHQTFAGSIFGNDYWQEILERARQLGYGTEDHK